ncbi:MAG: complex I NDUFA9 subunit family protein [Candidatus Promineifilaceae bacterium]
MILVTGSTGFIGRSLMARLSRENIPARPYNGRINNPIALRQQLDGIETVIHLAGSEARGRNRLLQHVDVEGTERLIEESRRAGVRHLIIPSRIGADPNAIQPLLRAKGEVERLVRHSHIPYTILRTATLYGRADRYFELIIAMAQWSWPFVWLPGGGTMPVQPLWVEDYSRCLVQTLERPDLVGKTITLAGDERFTYKELVAMLLNATRKPRIPVKLPMALMPPLTAVLFSWWYWPPVSRYFADRFFVPEVADLDSVMRHFGFRPARVQETLAYLNRKNLRWRLIHR